MPLWPPACRKKLSSLLQSSCLPQSLKLDLYIEGKDEQKVYDALNKMFVLEEF